MSTNQRKAVCSQAVRKTPHVAPPTPRPPWGPAAQLCREGGVGCKFWLRLLSSLAFLPGGFSSGPSSKTRLCFMDSFSRSNAFHLLLFFTVTVDLSGPTLTHTHTHTHLRPLLTWGLCRYSSIETSSLRSVLSPPPLYEERLGKVAVALAGKPCGLF